MVDVYSLGHLLYCKFPLFLWGGGWGSIFGQKEGTEQVGTSPTSHSMCRSKNALSHVGSSMNTRFLPVMEMAVHRYIISICDGTDDL